MYCEKSHQGGSVHLWSATHSTNSGALSGLAAVLAARLAAGLAGLAAVLAARLATVLAARLAAVLAARLVAGDRPHILIYTEVRLAANKKIPKYTVEFYTRLFTKLRVWKRTHDCDEVASLT